jgi:hypothetical protein
MNVFGKPKATGEMVMVEKLQRRLYAMVEIRQSIGRLIKETVVELHDEGKLTDETVDAVCERLAFKLCAWDLHPVPKAKPIPDPVSVKEQIRSRLTNGSGVKISFPDLKPRATPLAEAMLACLNKR